MNQPEKKADKKLKNTERDLFLYPITGYRGLFSPEKLLLNANLQEFAQRVSYLVGLHTNGKLSTGEVYKQLDHLWIQLQKSKEATGIDDFEQK
ncbi:DUF7219 family protein [Gloeothece verrucosa]|uniref:Isopropylmalate/homocitrate/citramalate synthase n=1 Tax=Gloeothece verrucosa (strain PCC 7822) TaxID=497965 RepID=E0UFH9_GLOV7|nr:hypothetical protein [Gloeothece verrucosa]ADN16673.1 conserved hypothetical protein [Gloeothece verrucosa PCC 7822]